MDRSSSKKRKLPKDKSIGKQDNFELISVKTELEISKKAS